MFGWKEGMARNTSGGELGCKAKGDALTFSNNTAVERRDVGGHMLRLLACHARATERHARKRAHVHRQRFCNTAPSRLTHPGKTRMRSLMTSLHTGHR